ncbi:hypothetical protein BHE74_00010203 [Ensete ventricosum]|nr:hypothetical protein BHE74_00010203 [Ensete ventricosum]
MPYAYRSVPGTAPYRAELDTLVRIEVRGIANSKDSVLMQRLEHGRRSVRGHPKAQDPDNGALNLAKWSKEARKRRRGRRGSATQKVKCRLERIAKGYRCKATDSRAMDLAAPWYRRGGTSVESSIPCSHGGRALVVKGAEDVENAEANSKYQDRTEG